MNDDLPQGWAETTIGEVAEDISYGYTAKASSITKGPRYLRITDIQNNTVDWDSVPFCSIPAKRIPTYALRGGDLVFARTGATTGKSFLIKLCPEAVFASYLIRVRPVPGLMPEFLASFFRSPSYWSQISENISGSAQPNCNATKLSSLLVPVPPLTEQKRIVAMLDQVLDKVDACQTRLIRIPALLKRFRQSVLAAACSGRLTADWRSKNGNVEPSSVAIEMLRSAPSTVKTRRGVPDAVPVPDLVADWDLPGTWSYHSTADLLRCGAFEDVKDGNHGSNHPKVAEFTKTGLPFITAAQVNDFRIDYDGAYKLAGEPLKRIHVGFAQSGDVIYTHKGSVGRVAIADRDCVLTPQTTYYRVNPKTFANGFVMFYLASQSFSEQANIVKEQTTRDFVPISEQYLLFHRVPPLPEQQEIVRRVEKLFALADRIEVRFAEAQKGVDSITQSVLAKAFRGELVPTEYELAKSEGRWFESAEELLEKIRSNGQSEEKKAKSRGRRSPKNVSSQKQCSLCGKKGT